MGALFYIVGILLVILFLGLASYLYVNAHPDEVCEWLVGKLCYTAACERGFVRLTDEDDKKAIEYAKKYHKKRPWIVY